VGRGWFLDFAFLCPCDECFFLLLFVSLPRVSRPYIFSALNSKCLEKFWNRESLQGLKLEEFHLLFRLLERLEMREPSLLNTR
jgi:hypothetical protein